LQAEVGDMPCASPTGTNWKAIASLVCGILFFFLPAALLAIVFGHLSLAEIRKSAGRLTGHSIAMAGLILGYIGMGLLVILLVVSIVLWKVAARGFSLNPSKLCIVAIALRKTLKINLSFFRSASCLVCRPTGSAR
jgi:Domain of unknown function (DUF4190)